MTLLNLSRRDVLKLSAAGVSAVSLSGWFKVLASRAAGAYPASINPAFSCGWTAVPATRTLST